MQGRKIKPSRHNCTSHYVALIILTGSYPPNFNAAFCLNIFLIKDGFIAVELNNIILIQKEDVKSSFSVFKRKSTALLGQKEGNKRRKLFSCWSGSFRHLPLAGQTAGTEWAWRGPRRRQSRCWCADRLDRGRADRLVLPFHDPCGQLAGSRNLCPTRTLASRKFFLKH